MKDEEKQELIDRLDNLIKDLQALQDGDSLTPIQIAKAGSMCLLAVKYKKQLNSDISCHAYNELTEKFKELKLIVEKSGNDE